MADVSDNGSFNLGLANITSQNYGPTATANQANTNANTAQVQQQAQAAAMQNKIMQARMPLILAGIHDESVGSGDSSGVGRNSAQKNSTGPQTPGQDIADQDKSDVAPDQNFYQPALIDASIHAKY